MLYNSFKLSPLLAPSSSNSEEFDTNLVSTINTVTTSVVLIQKSPIENTEPSQTSKFNFLNTNLNVCSACDNKNHSHAPSKPPLKSELFRQRISGMRRANNLSEWQLQAVLFKAKLTQYFETFISQGGDDIDQIMQCDEHEFLEIMSLVEMASKPLHVRRLQRTLNEFSLNRAQFLLSSIAFIGLPPMDLNCSTSDTDNLAAALKFLIPGFLPAQLNASYFGLLKNINSNNSNFLSETLNIKQNENENNRNDSFLDQQFEMPTLAETDINQLKEFAQIIIDKVPKIEPCFVQNKKKLHKELDDAMFLLPNHPDHLKKIRQFSAIYGQFDTKRKSNKPLTFNEALINEAAAQLCLCRPELLIQRDELFSLAKKLVRTAGFQSSSSTTRSYQHSDTESACNEGNSKTEVKHSDHSRTSSRSSIQSLNSCLSPSPSLKSGNESGNGFEENVESKIFLDSFTTTNNLQTNVINNNLSNSKFCLGDSNFNFNEKNNESTSLSECYPKKRRIEDNLTFNYQQFFKEENQNDLPTTSLNTITNN